MVLLLTAVVAAVVALLTVSIALANRRSAEAERIAALERKVDQLMNHLDLAPTPIPVPTTRPVVASPSPTGSPSVTDLIRQGKKIQAIKVYRDQTGMGLKEAKDAVERMERDGIW